MDASKDPSYSIYPWYVIREGYCQSISKFGALPVPLTHEESLIDDYLGLIDGLVLTGGDFDHDPALWGETKHHPKLVLNAARSAFEIKLLKKALALKIPFLGICAGHQLLNILYGGTIIQHIPDEISDCLNHSMGHCRHEVQHDIIIEKNTRLHALAGHQDILKVNTSHHQAIGKLGSGLVVSARAPDGVIEAIEHPDFEFCVGVEWHPEFLLADFEHRLYQAFIDAARNYGQRKKINKFQTSAG